jgi:hypothetical protein
MATAKKSASRSKTSAKRGSKSGNTRSAPRSKSTRMKAGGASSRRGETKSRSAASRGSAGRTASRGGSRPRTNRKSTGRTSKSGQVTIDHDEIRQWVESRGGTPATVAGTERDSEAAGLLRIDFPGYSGEGTLEPVEWDEFFEKFEEAKLAFLYDTDKGSKFNKFIARGSKRF